MKYFELLAKLGRPSDCSTSGLGNRYHSGKAQTLLCEARPVTQGLGHF